MNNKLSITYLILIIAPFFFGCRGAVAEEEEWNFWRYWKLTMGVIGMVLQGLRVECIVMMERTITHFKSKEGH